MHTSRNIRVLVWSKIPDFKQTLQVQATKQNIAYSLQFDYIDSHDALVNCCETTHAQILIADPPEITKESWDYLFQKQPIKWIQSTWAGVEGAFHTINTLSHLDREKIKSVLLTKKGGFGPHIVEYALQHMLNYERKYDTLQKAQKEKEWADSVATPYRYRTLRECVVGIMGYGDIGQHVAKVLKQCFSMRIHVLRRAPCQKDENVDQFFSSQSNGLEHFLSSGLDFLLNTMPSTNETKGALDKGKLQQCAKTKPCFLNMGRGDLISEKEIIKALDNGWISQAVLDVFDKEPLSSESNLWSRSDVVITPHCSAKSFKEETASIFFENLELYMKGKRLKYLVNWNDGY